MNEQEFAQLLASFPRPVLEATLVDIYSRLNCDEDGNYNPSESVAGGSAADFVDSCNYTFNGLYPDQENSNA